MALGQRVTLHPKFLILGVDHVQTFLLTDYDHTFLLGRQNMYVKNGTNFRNTAVGFFLFLVCSIYKCFCKHHHAPPARHNCELFLPTFAAASVSQRFSPLCFKVFSALHATWTNTCETEADATHSCSESFVPFLEERVTCLAQTFLLIDHDHTFLLTTCRIKNLGSRLKCRLLQKARQNKTASFLVQSSSQLVE